MRKSLFLLAIFVFGANFLVGCTTDPDPGTNQPAKKVYPATGSSYTYTKSNTDASGNPKAGTDTTLTTTVTAGVHSFASKDSVATFVETGGWKTDTTDMSYESSGDVSLYRGNGIPGLPFALPVTLTAWWQLPGASGTAVTIVNVDTNVSLTVGTFPVTVKKVVGTATKKGTEDITVGAKTLACQKTDVTFTITGEVIGLGELSIVTTTTYYYCQDLGYFVKYVQTNDPKLALLLGANAPSNYVQVLTAFSLK